MKILFVLSQTQLTGAEVYATTLADALMEQGHQVTVVSDRLHKSTQAKVIAQPISKRSWPWRIRNFLMLLRLQREHKFDLIHAHSRAASWICHFVSWWSQVPYVSTVHGRQHVHRSSQRFSVYGQKVLCVCENIRESLSQHLKIPRERLLVVRNPVKVPALNSSLKPPILSFLGRPTGPKGQRTISFLKSQGERLLSELPELVIQVGGGNAADFGDEFAQLSSYLKEKCQHRFQVLGPLPNLFETIARSTLVMGSGRVAMEALLLKTSVLAVGEYGAHGIIGTENWSAALSSNFGDVGVDGMTGPVDDKALGDQVIAHFRNPVSDEVRERLAEKARVEFDVESHVAKILEIYRDVRMRFYFPFSIPIFMYHKLVEKPTASQHRIFLTVRQFRKHLAVLRATGQTPVTFTDLWRFREGLIPISEFPKNPVILTFDDGYKNNYEYLLPLLKRHQIKAVIYVLGDLSLTHNSWDDDTGEPADVLMSASERQAMIASGLVEFGAHGVSHRSLVDLPTAEATLEVQQAKQRLEKETGGPVVSFAYPFGKLNPQVKQIVRDQGYVWGVSTDHGGLNIEDDPFEVFRVPIFPQDGYRQFFRKSRPSYRRYFYRKHGR